MKEYHFTNLNFAEFCDVVFNECLAYDLLEYLFLLINHFQLTSYLYDLYLSNLERNN